MKIAFVSDAVYPYNKGGKEKRLYEFSVRLSKMGHEVHIYSMKWWEGPNVKTENGVQLHGICKYRPLYKDERRSISEAIIFAFACFKLIGADFEIADVDQMPYFPLYSMWIVCQLRGKKMFATWNEVWGRDYWAEYMGNRVNGRISYLIERFSVLLPNTVISISPHTTQRLVNILNCKRPIIEVACGLNFSQISKIQPADNKSDIIYAGRLLKHKRVDLLIRAVAKLKATGQIVTCIIVGEGPERKRLENLVAQLGLEKQIAFHDFYANHEDVFALMKAAKVFASPSEREGFGIVVVEANACGKPVVANLAPANASKDLIQHGVNGFLFEQTVDALAVAITNGLDQALQLGAKCLSSARKYDWGKLAIKLIKAYAE